LVCRTGDGKLWAVHLDVLASLDRAMPIEETSKLLDALDCDLTTLTDLDR